MIITDPLSNDLHGNQRGFRKTSINQQVYEVLLIVIDQRFKKARLMIYVKTGRFYKSLSDQQAT